MQYIGIQYTEIDIYEHLSVVLGQGHSPSPPSPPRPPEFPTPTPFTVR